MPPHADTTREDRRLEARLRDLPTIVHLARDRAATAGHRTALVAGGVALTAAELDRRANGIAHGLRARGLTTGDLVAVACPPGALPLVAVLGVLKAGCAFLPVDVDLPDDRVRHFLADARPALVVGTDAARLARFGVPHAAPDALAEGRPTTDPGVPLTSSDLCCVIYTSGSTGTPKGVRIGHAGVANYATPFRANQDVAAAVRHDVTAIGVASIGFDAFFAVAFTALANGLRLVLPADREAEDPVRLAELMRREGVTYLNATASRLDEYARAPEFLDALRACRVVVQGGEPFPPALFAKLRAATDAEVYNAYGPTEATIGTHVQEITDGAEIGVGRPVHAVGHLVVDGRGRPLATGLEGELLVSGPGLALGYVGDHHAGQRSFVVVDGVRHYRTGDLARLDAAGRATVLGRVDRQVKVRGVRVDPAEVANAVRTVPGVDQAVVAPSGAGDRLVAWYTGSAALTPSDLREGLLRVLPAALVPSAFVRLAAIPTTGNGKVDHDRLPEPATAPGPAARPATPLEGSLHDIVAAAVGTAGFGTTDSLVERGMTSLTAMTIAAGIGRAHGKAVSMRDVVAADTVARLAAVVGRAPDRTADVPAAGRADAPLTAAQLGVYLEAERSPSLRYNLPARIDFGPADRSAVVAALEATFARHPHLSTRLEQRAGVLVQVAADDPAPEITVVPDGDADALAEGFVRPFDLVGSPLHRVVVVESAGEVVVLVDFHHVIFDGRSWSIFVEDLLAAYEGRPPAPAGPTALDLAHRAPDRREADRRWHADRIGDGEGATRLSNAELRGEPGPRERADARVARAAVADRASLMGVTAATFFLGATALVVGRLGRTADVRIATVCDARPDEHARTVGMFATTVPIVLDAAGGRSVHTYLRDVGQRLHEVTGHQDYPYADAVREFGYEPQVLFAHQDDHRAAHPTSRGVVRVRSLSERATNFPLLVAVGSDGDDVTVRVETDTRAFPAGTAATIAECLVAVCAAFTRADAWQRRLGSVPISSAAQVERVRRFGDGGETANRDRSVVDLLQEHVERTPDRVALITGAETLTYRELAERSDRVARGLVDRGIGRGDCVPLVLERTSALVVAMIGVMKAGAAFLPVDPRLPADRTARFVADTGAVAALTDEANRRPGGVVVDVLLREPAPGGPRVDARTAPDDPCCYIFTSGSTGTPKGVVLTHRNLVNYVSPYRKNTHIRLYRDIRAVALSIITVSFDGFLHECFSVLANGLTFALAGDDAVQNPALLAEFGRRSGANAMAFTASRLRELLGYAELRDLFAGLELVVQGGEPFTDDLLDAVRRRSAATVLNIYGPTEACVSTNQAVLVPGAAITVGPPLNGVREQVVDAEGHPLPVGVTGELWIAGDCVSPGYVNRPDLNARSFTDRLGERHYRTGDLARWTPGGEVVVLGRVDRQVKLRGARVELEEVEAAIHRLDAVADCAVAVRDVAGREHLCAWFVTGSADLTGADLRTRLAASLPSYMVPTQFARVAAIPRSPQGKADVRSLPTPAEDASRVEFAEAADEVEKFFCRLFEEVLSVDRIGATHDFFECGGTSLDVARITLAAWHRGLSLTYADVFAAPTARALARTAQDRAEPGPARPEAGHDDHGRVASLLAARGAPATVADAERRPIGDALVLGATGFLGSHVVFELLRDPARTVRCPVRPRPGASAGQRLRDRLDTYFGSGFHDSVRDRLEVVEADDLADLGPLACDTVYNCAGSVKHFSAADDIESTNLRTTRAAVALAARPGRRLVHVSSISVAGDARRATTGTFTEAHFHVGQDLSNQYARSKFRSEQVVFEAVLDGLDAQVMRVGNLMPRFSDGTFQVNGAENRFAAGLRAHALLGVVPAGSPAEAVELSPVDLTARAVVLLSTASAGPLVFHPFNPTSTVRAEVLASLAEAGRPVRPVDPGEFEEAFERLSRDPAHAADLAPLIAFRGSAGDGGHGVEFSCAATDRLLAAWGFRWPVLDRRYLSSFVAGLAASGALR
ncbi:amino acid adenylation domain-containing protein [Actinosynnema sp. NPDC050436]|uniref:amino acid adenylation domain-containing protein n=1 Tax=Actinosynnema sp. NPDC050436 TaxID=3155659 RepID=UPI0033FA9997